MESYKYLGIQLTLNLCLDEYTKVITKKINFLANSFYCLKNKTNDLRFTYNTWQLFLRPLLNYMAVAAAYFEDT